MAALPGSLSRSADAARAATAYLSPLAGPEKSSARQRFIAARSGRWPSAWALRILA